MRKLLALLMCVLLVVTPLAGCKQESNIDKTKTQLYLGVFEGGIGTAYLDKIIKDFENDPVISSTSFEEGKTGVQVLYDTSKDDYTAGSLKSNAKYMKEDIFILNDVSVSSLVGNGIAADITSIVTENAYAADGSLSSNGTKSIASRIEDYVKDYYNLGTEQAPRYYSIPYGATMMGITYDADLFEDAGYYFNTDNEIILDGSNKTLSLGADGVESYDDGLPQTWEEFKDLLEVIRLDNNIPLTWAYQPVIYYRIAPFISLWAQYEGANDFSLNYSYSGTDSQFGEINEENAYQLYGQNGRLAALIAAKDIISNPKNYSTHVFYSSQTHTEAQKEFISSIRGVNGQSRIAMLFEGGWWENESRAVFNEMGKTTASYGYGKRNFKFMPMPNFIGTEGVPDQTYDGRTINIQQTNANICVNRKTEKMELCKLFLQFMHTEENLRLFTRDTGVFKPFYYTLTEDDYNALTPYARSCWDCYSDENVEKVTPLTSSSFREYLGAKVSDKEWQTRLETYGDFIEPLETFFNYPNITPQQYFEGSISYYNSIWAGQYSNYLFSLN